MYAVLRSFFKTNFKYDVIMKKMLKLMIKILKFMQIHTESFQQILNLLSAQRARNGMMALFRIMLDSIWCEIFCYFRYSEAYFSPHLYLTTKH